MGNSMAKRHLVNYDKENLYRLVESLNSGELPAELFRENERILKQGKNRSLIDISQYIFEISTREMEMIEQIDLKGKEEYHNANFSIYQEKPY